MLMLLLAVPNSFRVMTSLNVLATQLLAADCEDLAYLPTVEKDRKAPLSNAVAAEPCLTSTR
jgi:hypothetical protein